MNTRQGNGKSIEIKKHQCFSLISLFFLFLAPSANILLLLFYLKQNYMFCNGISSLLGKPLCLY